MTKKITLFIAALFLCGTMQAQSYHWSYNYHDYENNFPFIGEVYLNGVALASSDFEIAAFVGDQVRATEFLFEADPTSYPGRYYAWLGVAYNNTGETVTFKLYDHATNTEYDNCSTTVLTNANGYGETWDPVVLQFTAINYGPDYPWIPGNFENYMYLETQIQINSVPVTNTNWEVGAFCGDVCRGLGDADNWWISPVDQSNILEIVVGGATGDVINFYLYDVTNQEIFPGICTVTLDWIDGDIGDMFDPFVLNFQNNEPIAVLDGGYWNINTTWDSGQVPPEYSDVIIMGDVIIPSGYTAYAGEISFAVGGSLTIEPGGELLHSNEIPVTMQTNISGYNRDNNQGYRLIASPVHPNVEVASTGLVTVTNYDDVDLYSFDQSEDLEWRNYKDSQFTTLDLMNGYLYACEQDVFAVYSGMTLPTNVTAYQDLVYDNNADFKGWNLVGNPFTCSCYITDNNNTGLPYYVLNPAGTEVSATTTTDALAPLKGAFVQATEPSQKAYFTTTQPSRSASLGITLSQGRGKVDNAYINFGGGNTLEKFQLNPNHTKIYFPIDGKNYAVANAEESGEMPVNFKAETSGSYTLGIHAQEMNFRYLHLIDNLTGADVDLLANPAYTFNAKTTDYASRFKLVFVCGDASDDHFAFFSNGNWIIDNDGKAILQVIDVNGRILSSETISGCASVNINEAAGVYMMRLIKGENVKVQKIIVR